MTSELSQNLEIICAMTIVSVVNIGLHCLTATCHIVLLSLSLIVQQTFFIGAVDQVGRGECRGFARDEFCCIDRDRIFDFAF